MVRSCVKSEFLILFGNVARAMLVFSFALGRTRFLFGLRVTDGMTRLSYRFAYRVEHRPPVVFPGAFRISGLHRCSDRFLNILTIGCYRRPQVAVNNSR